MRTRSPRIVRAIAAIAGGSLGAAAVVAIGAAGVTPVADGCGSPVGAASRSTRAEPLLALDGNGVLSLIDADAGSRSGRPPVLEGVARHASAHPRFGTAFVDDRRGDDALVLTTAGSATVLAQSGEILHPSWSPAGDLAWSTGEAIRVRVRSAGSTVTVDPPEGTVAVSYPVFVGRSRLVAVAEESIGGVSSEFESLGNLWRLDLQSRSWTRLTSFTATQERWSVIRTPIRTAAGELLFVRVQGEASRTRAPRFELWALRGDRASLARSLGGEMYLAGQIKGGIVWNIADASGRWHLLLEELDGHLSDLGCGRVMVDPLTESDPDLAPVGATGGKPSSTPSPSPSVSSSPSPGTELPTGLGILVGDFATREEAEMMAGVIAFQFGVTPTVIDASTQPTLVRPGAYAAAIPLVDGADPELELQRFRDLVPEARSTSWIVALT